MRDEISVSIDKINSATAQMEQTKSHLPSHLKYQYDALIGELAGLKNPLEANFELAKRELHKKTFLRTVKSETEP